MLPLFPFVYPILDASVLPAQRAERAVWLREAVVALAGAGVGLLQYRNKDGSDAEVLDDAGALRDAAPPGMRLLLNDRVHLVELCGFDGVHVGQGDLAPAGARAVLGEGKIVGLSTHTLEQLRVGDGEPVDYLAYGPVFATGSKVDAEPVVGLVGLREARGVTGKPLVGIGGITRERAGEVVGAGADGVAVISAVFRRGGSPGEAAKLAGDFLRHFRYNTR